MKTLVQEVDERSLIEAAQSEPARFSDLYEQNFARIYAFFARRVGTREEAQDLTAETFHQALASIRSFRWQGTPFLAWLYGIAANVLAGHWRKIGRSDPLDDLDFSTAGVEIERSLQLSELVDALSRDQRRVIILRFIHQLSIREIAQEMGRSEGAVKQLQLRALENLRQQFGRRP